MSDITGFGSCNVAGFGSCNMWMLQVLVRGLTLCVTPEMLTEFLEDDDTLSVSEVMYGVQPDRAICIFREELGRYCEFI